MTDFTPDFAGSAPGYEEVARPLLLGVDPLILALLAALILLAGLVGWWLRGLGPHPDGEEEVAKAIHARILKAAKAARAAESDRLIERARSLQSTVQGLLGSVLDVGKATGLLAAIDKALAGKIAPGPPAPAPAPNPAVAVTVVTTGQAAAPSPPPTTPGEMTGKQQLDELDKAVRAFHDHWARREERIQELRAARRQLSRLPPKADDHGHADGHDDHHAHDGDDHGAHRAKPVWERAKKSK